MALTQAALAAQPTERYIGIAYSPRDDQVLYHEVHYLYQAQGERRQLVVYQCPDGSPFARKLLHNSPASAAPDFDFVDARSGYREGVRATHGARETCAQKSRADLEHTQILPETSGAVIDVGFDTFARTHWDALQSASAAIPFLVPSRLSFVSVRLIGSQNGLQRGEPTHDLRMQLASWYGFALPIINLSYTTADHRLWRFEGIGTSTTSKVAIKRRASSSPPRGVSKRQLRACARRGDWARFRLVGQWAACLRLTSAMPPSLMLWSLS